MCEMRRDFTVLHHTEHVPSAHTRTNENTLPSHRGRVVVVAGLVAEVLVVNSHRA